MPKTQDEEVRAYLRYSGYIVLREVQSLQGHKLLFFFGDLHETNAAYSCNQEQVLLHVMLHDLVDNARPVLICLRMFHEVFDLNEAEDIHRLDRTVAEE